MDITSTVIRASGTNTQRLHNPIVLTFPAYRANGSSCTCRIKDCIMRATQKRLKCTTPMRAHVTREGLRPAGHTDGAQGQLAR